MATLSTTCVTLAEWAKRIDPDGKIDLIAEMLDQTNEIIADMLWIEGNLPTGHRTTVRTGLPTPTWRKLYGGVQPTKSTTRQIQAATGMLEAYSEVDKALADLNGNTAAFRMSEDAAHVEGMNQEFASTVIYGNETTEPEAFTGIMPHYNSTTAESGDNILLAGGSGADNASILLVGWGDNEIHGIFPKGSTAGLNHSDLGEVTVENMDGNNGRAQAYRSHYRWDCGLVVRDWRYCVRIANIDKSDLSEVYTGGEFATGANLPSLMYQAMRLIPNLGAVRPAFYASRDICTWVARQLAAATQSSTLVADDVSGNQRWTERFKGIPLRRVDAMAANEALVS